MVWVDRPVTEDFLEPDGGRSADPGHGDTAVPGEKTEGERCFSIVLTQGLNRQIRRMCEALGYRVERLKRIRIMNIRLDGLEPGQIPGADG